MTQSSTSKRVRTSTIKFEYTVLIVLIMLFNEFLSAHWQKMNTSPVCFGAKNNKFGKFRAPYGGKLAAVKLVYLHGYVTCAVNSPTPQWSFWGCGNKPSVINHVNVVITTSSNSIILPPRQFFTLGRGKWSEIPGYNSFSPEIILSFISGSHSVHAGEHLRLWYGEDHLNWTEGDNDGRVCCDVYALYVEYSY